MDHDSPICAPGTKRADSPGFRAGRHKEVSVPALPVAAAVGLCLGFYPRFLPFPVLFAVALAAVAFGLVLASLARPDFRAGGRAALILGLFVCAGLLLDRDNGMRDPGFPPEGLRILGFSGRLSKDASSTRGGATLYRLEVERLRLGGPGVAVEQWSGGARATALARVDVLVRGGPFLDAGTRLVFGSVSGAAPGGSLLFAQARDVGVLDRGAPIEGLRSSLREGLRRALGRVGDRSTGLLLALILGARDSLDREDADAFRAAGCSHILALSGQHLSILALIAVLALRPLVGPLRARFGAALLAGLFVWMAGPSPSLLRAGLMAWLGAIAAAFDRPQPWLVIIALSLVISLPLDVEGARSLSFVLSYLAVLGLALLAPRAAFLLLRWLPPPLATAVAASLAAQLATAPVVIATFGTLSLVGVFAAVAAAPLVTVFMWWGMGAALLCSILRFLAPIAVEVSDRLYLLFSGVMRIAASVPGLTVNGTLGKAAAILAVGAAAAFVYARSDVDFRLWTRARSSGLRCAHRAQGSVGARGTRHVEALRTELPGE